MIRKIVSACVILVGAACVFGAPRAHAQRVDHPSCTSEQLHAVTNAYVEAQRKGDISHLPLADSAEFLENMKKIKKTDGLWNKALPVAYTDSFHDPVRCKTFTEIVVTDGGHPYVIGTRLYMNKGKIVRMDSLVTDKGDWLFNANAYKKYASSEDWGVLPAGERTPAQDLINGANAYLDQFSDKFTKAPWGRPCARLEGGAYTNPDHKKDATCEVGIPKGVPVYRQSRLPGRSGKGCDQHLLPLRQQRKRHAGLPYLPLRERQVPLCAYVECQPDGHAIAAGQRRRWDYQAIKNRRGQTARAGVACIWR